MLKLVPTLIGLEPATEISDHNRLKREPTSLKIPKKINGQKILKQRHQSNSE